MWRAGGPRVSGGAARGLPRGDCMHRSEAEVHASIHRMPKRSRRYGRRRRRMGKRRYRSRRMQRKRSRIANTVHSFIRTTENTFSVTYGTTLYKADDFRLSYTPAASEFTPLYDQYRIKSIKRTIFYSSTGADTTGTTGPYGPAGCPMLYMVRDYDDAVVPTATTELMQRPYCSIRRLTSVNKVFIRPRMARAIYQPGATFAYGTTRGWLDVTNPDVPHYGLKYIIVPQGGFYTTPGTIYGTVRIVDKYYLQFKNPR